MKRSRLGLAALIAIGGVVLIVAICYASLLGENNKIDELSLAFFSEVQRGMPGEAASGVRMDVPGTVGDVSDSLFLLELSLLDHYQLLGATDYEVVTERSGLWVPFLRERPVSVSVSFRKKVKDKSLGSALASVGHFWSSDKDPGFVRGLLTIGRKNGSWVIASVNIKGSVLAKTYEEMGRELLKRQDAARTGRDLAVLGPVSTESLRPVDRQMLLHLLRKAQARLEGPSAGSGKEKASILRLR